MLTLILAALLDGSAADAPQPTEQSRPYVKVDAERQVVELGILPSGATSVPRQTDAQSITLNIVQPDQERWPVPVTVTLSAKGAVPMEWRAELPSHRLTKPWQFRVSPGRYELVLSAPHHRTLRETVELSTRPLILGQRALRLNPVIRGTVQSAEKAPISAATVQASEELVATTDALGRFSLEVERDWPQTLEFSYPGMATRIVDVPRAERSVTLPAVTLKRGGVLRLEVDRGSVVEEIKVEVRQESKAIRFRKLPADATSLSLEDLGEGEYVVTLRGDDPFEVFHTKATITSGEIEERTIRLEPLRTQIEVTRGTSRVAGAWIEAIHIESDAKAEARTDAEGAYSANVWQRGEYLFAVRAREDAAPVAMVDRIDGDTTATVRLELPDRAVRGRVVDATSGAAIANAKVAINSTVAGGASSSVGVTADANGSFVIDALQAGVHELSAIAEEYIESEPVVVTLAESDRAREVAIQLRRGNRRTIAVVTRDGLPMRGASVIHAANGILQRIVTTNDAGEAEIPLPSDAANLFYVVPREGSLAVFRARPSRESAKIAIVVPDAVASLEIHAADASGKPIPDVRFLMRFDGEVIPPDVQRQIDRLRGYSPATGVDGILTFDHLPSGFFEFWPLRTFGEMQDILLTIGQSAPVQVALKPGRNVAALTFERKVTWSPVILSRADGEESQPRRP